MIAVVSAFYYLYLAALHTSIAGMEIFSSLLVAVSAYLLASRRMKFDLRREDRWLLAMLGGFAAWVAVSLMVNPLLKPFLFQWGFMRWEVVLVALTIALEYIWFEKAFQKRWTPLWVVLVTVTGAYAAFQSATGIDFIRHGAVSPQGGGVYKAVGFFSISLTFAYCFGILAFACFRPAMEWNRRAGILVVVCGAAGVLASMSRGAWLAGLACIFVYLGVRHRRLILPALAVVAVVIAALLLQGGGFAAKITNMAQLKMDHSSMVRVDLWRAYWQMSLEHPVFGVGIFNGDKVLPEYYEKLGIAEPFTSHAHNNLLNWLAGTGVPGLLFYVAICGFFLSRAWRLRETSVWGWSLFLAQLFVQLGGLTECNFIDGEVTHCIMLTWAITWVLDRERDRGVPKE